MAPWTSVSENGAIAFNSSSENSRPITAAICATAFTGASWSKRAINESCNVSGTSNVDCVPDRPSFDPPPRSSTAFVISSTKSGTPSVLSKIWSMASSGKTLLSDRLRTIEDTCPRSSRPIVTDVTCGCWAQGNVRSGRCNRITNIRQSRTLSRTRSSSFSEVWSAQCTSSNTTSAGCCAVWAFSRASTAPNVWFF